MDRACIRIFSTYVSSVKTFGVSQGSQNGQKCLRFSLSLRDAGFYTLDLLRTEACESSLVLRSSKIGADWPLELGDGGAG